jgi:hypothetical protein
LEKISDAQSAVSPSLDGTWKIYQVNGSSLEIPWLNRLRV